MAVIAGWGGRVAMATYAALPLHASAATPGPWQVIKANKWSVDMSIETADLTSTQGAQIAVGIRNNPKKINTKYAIPTVTEITVSVEAFYDTASTSGGAQFWFSGGFELIAGRTIALALYPDKYRSSPNFSTLPALGSSNAYWLFNSFLITQCTQTAEAKGITKITFAGKNNSPDYEVYNI